ncbi:nucleotidyltransferase-like protein [Ammoniphilus resinae]|uniref:Nucleotidyltransferase-like domain-containing protein n=1 Tax=Ammoniphilus resinae TaxID=861532 RepID=A0ABS4GJJ6_9BACL|nr:nucleotidyltransferase-like protein [Ammoniphilus resinae]MBP1930262.1 hypothetical protein [Ammoniphilus resinae]
MSLDHVIFPVEEDESVIRVVSSNPKSSILDGADEFFLIIGQNQLRDSKISHHKYNGKIIEKRRMDQKEIYQSVFEDNHRQVTQWLLLGEVLSDPRGIVASLRADLSNRDSFYYQKRIYIEFAGVVRKHSEAKEFLKEGHMLDSFNSTLQCLHHWARLAIMEAGEHPETTVWEQLKTIDPTVYKLYDELVTSKEPLDKRIELLLLALDFTVLSKMEYCVQFILDILKSRKAPWTVEEILMHPSIADRNFDLLLLLEKMSKRSIIREGTISRNGLLEKTYCIF